MVNYQQVSNQEEMEELLDSITGFHDSMTKEIHIMNRGHVKKEDLAMVMSHRFDAQLLIQSQWSPFGMELIFVGVLEMKISDAEEYIGAGGTVDNVTVPVEKTTVEMEFDTSLKIKAEKLFYRPRGEWLGAQSFLRSEVPSPDAFAATVLEDRWRQCVECCNIWQEDTQEQFTICPGCKRLTEMQ